MQDSACPKCGLIIYKNDVHLSRNWPDRLEQIKSSNKPNARVSMCSQAEQFASEEQAAFHSIVNVFNPHQ